MTQSPGEHYVAADVLIVDMRKLIDRVENTDGSIEDREVIRSTIHYIMQLAQVHATLATAINAYDEVVNLEIDRLLP